MNKILNKFIFLVFAFSTYIVLQTSFCVAAASNAQCNNISVSGCFKVIEERFNVKIDYDKSIKDEAITANLIGANPVGCIKAVLNAASVTNYAITHQKVDNKYIIYLAPGSTTPVAKNGDNPVGASQNSSSPNPFEGIEDMDALIEQNAKANKPPFSNADTPEVVGPGAEDIPISLNDLQKMQNQTPDIDAPIDFPRSDNESPITLRELEKIQADNKNTPVDMSAPVGPSVGGEKNSLGDLLEMQNASKNARTESGEISLPEGNDNLRK